MCCGFLDKKMKIRSCTPPSRFETFGEFQSLIIIIIIILMGTFYIQLLFLLYYLYDFHFRLQNVSSYFIMFQVRFFFFTLKTCTIMLLHLNIACCGEGEPLHKCIYFVKITQVILFCNMIKKPLHLKFQTLCLDAKLIRVATRRKLIQIPCRKFQA